MCCDCHPFHLFAALALNEFEGLGNFDCPNGPQDCPVPNSTVAIEQLGLGSITFWGNVGILIAMSAVYRFIALFALYRRYK